MLHRRCIALPTGYGSLRLAGGTCPLTLTDASAAGPAARQGGVGVHRRYRPAAGGSQLGVSLIDLLVGITLLSIGITAVVGAFSYAAGGSRLSSDYIVAENLAQDLLGEARDQPFSDLSTWYTYAGETGTSGLEQAFSQRLADSGLKQAQAWFTVSDVQTDLKGISVTITWGVGSPGGKVEGETMVSPRY